MEGLRTDSGDVTETVSSRWFRTLAAGLAWLGSRPAVLRYRLIAWLIGRDEALRRVSESLAGVPGLRGVWIRRSFGRSVLAHVGARVHIGFMTLLSKTEAELHDGVYLGRFCTVGRVRVESEAVIADGVQLLSGGHQHQAGQGGSFQAGRQRFERITIGRGAWIGANAVVMADVGPGAVVAAGAVVTRPVPAGARVGGVPALPLASRQREAA
jgi:acetyltransferase-like isoleucine patch superfamily enzyme